MKRLIIESSNESLDEIFESSADLREYSGEISCSGVGSASCSEGCKSSAKDSGSSCGQYCQPGCQPGCMNGCKEACKDGGK